MGTGSRHEETMMHNLAMFERAFWFRWSTPCPISCSACYSQRSDWWRGYPKR